MWRLSLPLSLVLPIPALAADVVDDSYQDDWEIVGEVGNAGEAIVNGELETEFPQTVALGAFGFSACTGSLITPRIILSAGHCGVDIPMETVVQLGSAYFGSDATNPDYEAGFQNMVVHPDYRPLGGTPGSLPAYDVAILELDQDAPIEPIWFRTKPIKDKHIGTEVLSVGFGITSAATQAGGGTKRSAVLTIDSYDSQFIMSRSATNENEANICSGDSGGPQYHFDEETGLWEQWAVHSWGDQNCLTDSGSTRTDAVKDWLLGEIERVHGTSDRCAINGRYGDGVCDTFCDSEDPDCAIPDFGGGDGDAVVAGGGGEEAAAGCGCATAAGPQGVPSAGFLLALLLGFRRRR